DAEGAQPAIALGLIVIGPAPRPEMDVAMEPLCLRRRHDRYIHSRARFYIEFPRGPLAIGGEYRIRPVMRSTLHGRIRMLSATDSCRDRLAAFYHWRDRQSLTVAAWIAVRNRVNLGTLRRWSVAGGATDAFGGF